MKNEAWIWVELIGFDNTLPDCGATAYIERAGFTPDGISLLLSASDFVLLHEDQEHELFPDICSRHGHEYNEERTAQCWTNVQLAILVEALHKHGVKVFFTISIVYFHDEFHQEWFSQHGGKRLGLVARLEDGSEFGNFFLEKLLEVMRYYSFDGWHISDGVIPDGNITDEGIATYENIITQFAEFVGKEKFPAEFLQADVDNDFALLSKRREFVWRNFKHEWCDYLAQRWFDLLQRITSALHGIGCEVMINSVCAKSIFETLFFCGFDMRRLSEAKLDYLVVESVATSMALITGDHNKLFDFAAATMELKAALPDLKLLSLTPCKDVVESFNSIRHAAPILERDFYMLANLFFDGKRCTDGFMICLGDSIPAEDWAFLRKLREQSFEFDGVASEGFSFLFEPSVFDSLRHDYDANGTLSPYLQVSELLQRSVEIFNVCTFGGLDESSALFVPNFDLLPPEMQSSLLKRTAPTVLSGNFPENAPGNGIFCRIGPDYRFGCVALNCGNIKDCEWKVSYETFDSFRHFSIFDDRCPQQNLPDDFWNAVGTLMRHVLHGDAGMRNSEDLFAHVVKDRSGSRRIALCSKRDYYVVSEFYFDGEGEPERIERIGDFPVHPLTVVDGKVTCSKSRNTGAYYAALRIPPRGTVLFDAFLPENIEK